MKDIKDNFSNQADAYAKYRPYYSDELFQFIYKNCKNFDTAWDCATGNGQAAAQLSKQFKKVIATDISNKQIGRAIKADNIYYTTESADNTSIENESIDLITVAQALHWFANDNFYSEVTRVANPGALFAAWGYNLLQTEPEIQRIILHFYQNIVGEYWDIERRYVEDCYTTLPFPFEEIQSPAFTVSYDWNLEHLLGYLNSWSSVQHYIKANNANPVSLIEEEIKKVWQNKPTIQVTFPIFLKAGIVKM